MDDLRIGSVPPYDPCREQTSSDSSKRRKPKHPPPPRDPNEPEPAEDYYTPSEQE
jgi:hypothetical protein